jgi:superfamily II DNA helicase RecQ
LIYQLAVPLVKAITRECDFPRIFPDEPIVIVVAPLQALVSDQITSCETLGLTCSKLDEIAIGECKVDLIFTSPEAVDRDYDNIRNLHYRIIGVVVDESHCVVNW